LGEGNTVRDEEWNNRPWLTPWEAVGLFMVLAFFALVFVRWWGGAPNIDVNALRTPVETER